MQSGWLKDEEETHGSHEVRVALLKGYTNSETKEDNGPNYQYVSVSVS